MPKPPSHPRYQAVARAEPYPSSAHRSGGGNNHGGGHGHSGRGSTGRMYHPAGVSTEGVTPGVPPAQQQSAAPPNFGYGPNTGIGAGSGPGASGMMNPQFPPTTTTSTPRTIPRRFGQQSSPSSSSSTYGQSFDSLLQGPNQHNSSPSSAPNFQLTGYQHHQAPLQQPLQHQLLQHHPQHQQQQHQSPTITNQNAAHPHPTQFPPQAQSQPQQQQQQHQPPSQSHHHHHQPPQASTNPAPTHNQRPGSPNHNPTTSWTPREDSLLLSSRASHLPWSELQRLHFPGKTANACRKRHERLMEKRQAEEEVDEDRLARIAGEYVRMREELWKGLADRMGMDVKEVEERCLGMGVGRLRVGSRQGGRRREGRGRGSYPVVATGMGMGTGMGVGMGVGMGGGGILPAQGQRQHGQHGMGMPGGMAIGMGDGTGDPEAKNYTHSPVQMTSTGTGRSPTGPEPAPGIVGPGPGAGPGMPGQGHAALNMLPPSAVPPLTTQVPISTATSGPGMTVPPPMPPPLTISPPGMALNQQRQHQHQHQPRVAFGGYLNGRSTSTARRQTAQSMSLSSTSASPTTASLPSNISNSAGPGMGYTQIQGNAQWSPQQAQQAQQHVSCTNQGAGVPGPARTGTTGSGNFGTGYGQAQGQSTTSGTGASSWGDAGAGGQYPPSSFD